MCEKCVSCLRCVRGVRCVRCVRCVRGVRCVRCVKGDWAGVLYTSLAEMTRRSFGRTVFANWGIS